MTSQDQDLSVVDHLTDLRKRLLRAAAGFLITLIALVPISGKLYSLFVEPLTSQFASSGIETSMVAIAVSTPLMTPIKLSAFVALLLSFPWVIYQIWLFVAPGLYQHEKKAVVLILPFALLLFYTGMAFSFFVILPLLFALFIALTPEGVVMSTDIGYYFDFVISNFIIMGLAFETPVVVMVLILSGATTVKSLANYRAYIILGSFAVGMLLTPPDVVSQMLFAIPIWLLFEVGLILSKVFSLEKKSES